MEQFPYNQHWRVRDHKTHERPVCSGSRSRGACLWRSTRIRMKQWTSEKQELIPSIRTIQNNDSTCARTVCKLTANDH